MERKIPIVDLKSPAMDSIPSRSSLQAVAVQLRNALHEVGFVYLVNHGIPHETIKNAFATSSKFFALDNATKEKYRKDPKITNHGWIQAGQELLNPNSVFEIREAFDFASTNPTRVEQCPEFCGSMMDFRDECEKFMKILLLPLLAMALDMSDESFFINCCAHLDNKEVTNESDLRLIFYPPLCGAGPIPEGTVRCAEHTDYELCTLLFQDEIGGLEVMSEGSWISATPIAGSILINTGDLLEYWTNGYFPATKHRVIIPKEEIQKRVPRYSFAYFFAPDDSTKVVPLFQESKVIKEFSRGRGSGMMETVTAYEHIMKRVKAAYQY